MRLSAPIYYLKRKAKLLSREENIPLHKALDQIAAHEGFRGWGMLVAKATSTSLASKFYSRLTPGDLVLVGARPGHGKTLLSLELAVENMRSGNPGMFFTLECTKTEVMNGFQLIGADRSDFESLFEVDNSDGISADYIVRKLTTAPRGTLAVIDYLQLLDQKRENPELMVQLRTLQFFARHKGHIFVFISQIHHSYDPEEKSCPDLRDVRLPNPLDLRLFSKACFLNNGEVRFCATASRRLN